MKFLPSWLSRAVHGRRKGFIIILVLITGLAIWAGDHYRRWGIYLRIKGVTEIHALSPDRTGYEIELLPFRFGASFVRNQRVYFIDPQGRLFETDDRSLPSAARLLGDTQIKPRMVFVSARGTIFVSGVGFPTVRSVDEGKTWSKSHDLSVWRMTENEASHTLYAGVYTRKERPRYTAKVLMSTDEGKTWQTAFEDRQLDYSLRAVGCQVQSPLFVRRRRRPSRPGL